MLFPFFVFTEAGQKKKLSQIVSIEPLAISNDFLSKNIQRLYQDNEGYIWFGTENQIYRYDGYNINMYDTESHSAKQIANNDVGAFAESDEYIWVGTEQGIRLIDKTNYTISDWDYEPLSNTRINTLLKDSENNIWIGTLFGLYKYSLTTGEITTYKYIYENDNSLPSNGINHIYEDKDKNIWILTWDFGLCRYVPGQDHFDRYPPLPGRNNPFRMFQDRDRNYWLATWESGLIRFFPERTDQSTYEKFEIHNSKTNNSNIFFSIVQDDRYGYIWAISYTDIFVITDIEKGEYVEMPKSVFSGNSNNLYNEIIKDRNGNLWIGTDGNVVYTINLNKTEIVNCNLLNTNYNSETTPSVSVIYEDESGLLWMGLKRMGLYLFDIKANRFVDIEYDKAGYEQIKNLISVHLIKEIKSTGEIWINFEKQYTIFAFKKQGRKLTFSRKIDLGVNMDNNPLTENSVSGIVDDRNGNIWIGTQAGLFAMDTKGLLLHYPNVFRHITSISEDKDGRLWIAGSDEGIICLNKDRTFFTSYNTENHKLASDIIQSVYCHSSGQIWAGDKKGTLYLFDNKENKFIPFVSETIGRKEPILDILEDENGNIWVSTNNKIMEIDPVDMKSYSYTQYDGLQISPFNKGALMRNRAGFVVFGGNKGFCYFPQSAFSQPLSSDNHVLVTNVNLQKHSIFNTKYKDNLNLKKSELILEPFQNNIEINFSAFNYFSKVKTEFAYRIEGIDDNWNYVSGEYNFAPYNNLRKGKYRFQVKMRNEYGEWDSEPAILYIYKKPHFYETWWAYIFYVISILSIVGYFFRSSLNRLKLKNELQIAQIEKAASEQLVQTKLRYFTNVSHELMTPLTIISFLVEDMQNNSKANVWQFKTMLSNINRLKRLLQQILDFRKMESGNMKLRVQWGDIVSFTNDICEHNFLPLIQKKQINFKFSSNEEKIELYYDSDKIDKVLYNLLSNAIKYTPENGNINVRIELATRNDENYVRLIVSDSGTGIAPEEIPNIFKRFYHSNKTKVEYSNGIGLSMTKELIEMHHGTIKVDSQLNAGTFFFIELPMNPNVYSEDDFYNDPLPLSQEIILSPTEDNSLKTSSEKMDITILIVEDNSELRFILNKILAKNYWTITAENGKQALEIVEKDDVDLIISDIVMPEMDGLTMCRTLKENIETSHLPVLLITARNSIEDRVECYDAGADGYLSKPFEQQVLDAKIRSLIKNRKSKQEIFRNNIELNVATLEYSLQEESFLNQMIELIQDKYLSDNTFDPSVLASELNMSRSSLYRKIKSLTDLSPSDFIRNIRLKQACVLLKEDVQIKEVAFAVGFVDQRYFSSCFKNEFGITPTEFQKRYRK